MIEYNLTCVDSSMFPTTAILARAPHSLCAYPSSRAHVSVAGVLVVSDDEVKIVFSAVVFDCGDDRDVEANK